MRKGEEKLTAIRVALPAWYKRHRRDLPWRRTRDPYAIWISEVMLQQTQVATVIPYFRKFLEKFPDVRAIAAARLGTVLKVWEGMGYYSRARNLHRTARLLVRECDGKLPETAQELLKLPGIGRYTAGAIASIAFGRREPALDGNVIRVFSRIFRIRDNPRDASTQKELWTLAHRLLPAGRGASSFNQALMDLGATVCTPRHPLCRVCPLKKWCEAYARNEQDKLPVRVRRAPTPHYDIAAGVIRRNSDGKILIARRRPEGLLGGLWEFPGGKRQRKESLEECVIRETREELGVRIKVLRPLVTVRHAYTHFRITLHTFDCEYLSSRPKALSCAAWTWVSPRELDRYPFPAANKKIIAAMRGG